MTYTDIMLDFETLADNQNAAILSMAAVPFNLESGEMGNEFYEHIDLQSCLDVGMEVTGNTFYWWLTKTEAARMEITSNEKRRHLYYIPSAFRAWIATVRQSLGEKDLRIWGNGAKFDLGIIDNIFRKTHTINPFDFRKERCVRTYASLRPDIMANFKFEGIKHHPVDDCRNQIRYVCQIQADIKKDVNIDVKKEILAYDKRIVEIIKSLTSPHVEDSIMEIKPLPEKALVGEVFRNLDGTFCGTSQGWVKIHEIIN